MDGEDDTPRIRFAETAADYAAFGGLCRAYFAWCRARYSEMPWFVDEVFGQQSFDEELKVLATKYGPPTARTMLAMRGGQALAGGAYHQLADGVCELKRLYVRDEARGLGLGRRLTDALIAAARTDGYRMMRLDTAHLLNEAIAMYESMGFRRIAPYRDYPARLTPYLVFMERPL
jgi:ribosomal protein S18 acetylase RimI-like enzyme